VKTAELSRSGKDQILLTFYAESDCSFEEWSVMQNKQAFSQAFIKELKVHCIISAEAAQPQQN
jgi:hypothetical protein